MIEPLQSQPRLETMEKAVLFEIGEISIENFNRMMIEAHRIVTELERLIIKLEELIAKLGEEEELKERARAMIGGIKAAIDEILLREDKESSQPQSNKEAFSRVNEISLRKLGQIINRFLNLATEVKELRAILNENEGLEEKVVVERLIDRMRTAIELMLLRGGEEKPSITEEEKIFNFMEKFARSLGNNFKIIENELEKLLNLLAPIKLSPDNNLPTLFERLDKIWKIIINYTSRLDSFITEGRERLSSERKPKYS